MENYIKILERNYDKFKTTLADLIAIPSVVGEASGNHPFGDNVNDALEYLLALGESDGFRVKNVNHYGGHIDMPGSDTSAPEEIVAVVGHIDIVPPGDRSNWKTNPYELIEKDGLLYGRGVLDDKGPLLCGYFAMKALKDSGFNPSKTIRLMIGCDEETSWSGMTYYMEHEKPNVVAGFSPDADFPAIHAEKGVVELILERKLNIGNGSGLKLIDLQGGSVVNAVADKAIAIVEVPDKSALDKLIKSISKYEANHKGTISYSVNELTVELTSHGVSAHGSRPDLGTNAISIMMDFLGTLSFADNDINSFLKFYNDHIGFTFNGEKLGINLSDKPSGKLTVNVGIVQMNGNKLKLILDVRYPVTCDLDQVYEGIISVVVPLGFRVEKGSFMPPLYKPIDDPLIGTLMNAYREFTGDTESQPIVIGGGTYARAVPNTVAFGATMPGREDMCHQPNEYIHESDLKDSMKIFAKAIYELAK